MPANFSKLLKKANLTPKERVTLFIANEIQKEREGKELLSEADITGLIDAWKPETPLQAQEYNRYIKAWRTFGMMELDMQTDYLNTVLELKANDRILGILYMHRFRKSAIEILKLMDALLTEGEANLTEHEETEMERKNLPYTLSTGLLKEETLEALKERYGDVKYESGYLLEEDEIGKLYDAKKYEELAELLAKMLSEEIEVGEVMLLYMNAKDKEPELTPKQKKHTETYRVRVLPKEEQNNLFKQAERPLERYYGQLHLHKLLGEPKPFPELLKDLPPRGEELEEWLKGKALKDIKAGFKVMQQPLCVEAPELLEEWRECFKKAKAMLTKPVKQELFFTPLFVHAFKYKFNPDELVMSQFVKEEKTEEGKKLLELPDKWSDHLAENIEGTKRGYAKVQGFKSVCETLGKIFSVDLSYKADRWLKELDRLIEAQNDTMEFITMEKAGRKMQYERWSYPFKDTRLSPVDTSAIEPATEDVGVKRYAKEFYDILGDPFPANA